ncbi:hypothetical protein LLH06_14465 [Mucilaginibacter daejeonensis]|uniref:hypothetical protein n=1 Tax=Mucilaginibacter daejeonensis TaxID=398049 RepID=UPI001D1785B8|nr:hypothetical protein [Mucilaginibacter daejeonensis]UEG52167.1 hypothetical protein LLH06_14465 [Mucilaginibacter daejeonensis]
MQRSSLLILVCFLLLVTGCIKKGLAPLSDAAYKATGPDLSNTDTARLPSGLPSRLAFGTEGDISVSDKYIPQCDYQYQYLAGDIFSNGWATWNSPNGQFARNFLDQIGKMGKMPVFTYYNIVPAKHRYEEPATTNLNDVEVMNHYFDDWKLLLQICKNYGKTVIIHYEPDLFGYLQMYRNDATRNTVKVGASKQADVLSFSNDAKGLAQAIVSMRNKYAPNVILAWHASQWSTGMDVIKGKHDPEKAAAETAAWYHSLNAKFDMIFSEFADRDAGYDMLVRNKADALWSVKAEEANHNLSDFDRFQRFLKKLNQITGQKIILWQIPIGNSITNTCNNTPGHYKDNRAEYFLQPVMNDTNTANLSAYQKAGVIAFLFGRGESSCTSYYDLKGNGSTASNETADDDGGFLRKGIKAYYQNGALPLN